MPISPVLRQMIRAFIMNNMNMFIDKALESTSMSEFKSWVKDEALYFRQRQVAQHVDELGLDISEESNATLHEHDTE